MSKWCRHRLCPDWLTCHFSSIIWDIQKLIDSRQEIFETRLWSKWREKSRFLVRRNSRLSLSAAAEPRLSFRHLFNWRKKIALRWTLKSSFPDLDRLLCKTKGQEKKKQMYRNFNIVIKSSLNLWATKKCAIFQRLIFFLISDFLCSKF